MEWDMLYSLNSPLRAKHGTTGQREHSPHRTESWYKECRSKRTSKWPKKKKKKGHQSACKAETDCSHLIKHIARTSPMLRSSALKKGECRFYNQNGVNGIELKLQQSPEIAQLQRILAQFLFS